MNDLLEYIVDGVLRLFGVAVEADDSPRWQNGMAIVLIVVALIFVSMMVLIYCL